MSDTDERKSSQQVLRQGDVPFVQLREIEYVLPVRKGEYRTFPGIGPVNQVVVKWNYSDMDELLDRGSEMIHIRASDKKRNGKDVSYCTTYDPATKTLTHDAHVLITTKVIRSNERAKLLKIAGAFWQAAISKAVLDNDIPKAQEIAKVDAKDDQVLLDWYSENKG